MGGFLGRRLSVCRQPGKRKLTRLCFGLPFIIRLKCLEVVSKSSIGFKVKAD
jgi:hypothetical protein